MKRIVKPACYSLSLLCACGCVGFALVDEFHPMHYVGAVSWFLLGRIYE